MSLSYPKVSPVRFIKAPDLSYDDFMDLCTTKSMEFCQKVEVNDETNFQINLNPISSTELVSNGDFSNGATDWTLGAGWSVVSEQLQHASGAGTATQTITTTSGRYYRLTFEIISVTGSGMQVTAGDGDETFTTIGVKSLFFFANAATEVLTFDMVVNSELVTLDDVSIVEMSLPGVIVRNCDDNMLAFSDFDLENSGNAVFKDDKVLFMFNWSSITDITGCFQICVGDLAAGSIDFITNGGFADGSNWVAGAKWSIAAGVATFDALPGPNAEALRTLTQTVNLDGGKKYTLTYTITNASSSTGPIRFNLDGVEFARSAGNGTFVQEIDLTGDTDKATLDIIGADFIELTLDNISIINLDEIDACSECYCLRTTWDCTLQFSWTQGDDFGSCFAYSKFDDGYGNSLFTNFVRMDAKLQNPTYPKDKRIHLFSNGKTQLLHSKTEKHFELFVDFMPEYLHDALSVAVEHDTFNITESYIPQQEDEYVALEEDYSPEWADNMRVATATVNLRKKIPDCDRDNSNC